VSDDHGEGTVLEAAQVVAGRGRVTLEVGGLDCADCARNLERALNMIPGIERATVSFATAGAIMQVNDPAAVAQAHVAARDLGFVLIDVGTGDDRPSSRLYGTIAAAILLVAGWIGGRSLPPAISLGLVLASVLVGGTPIFGAAIGALKRRMLTVDVLVSLAVVAAVASGEALAAAQVVVLMSVGELLEERTVARSRRAVRQLLDLAPKTVTLLRDGLAVTVARDQVVVGDLVVVKPGGRVPVDGTVVAGRADVSEAPVTGESRLLAKGPGDTLFAGSLAQDGILTIRADHVGPDTTLARIAAMIEEAQSRQAPVARQVDRFATVFIPISLLAAALVLVVTREPQRAVTILIGACPCALVLSTPVAVYAAIGGASRRGLLVKGGLYLERLGRIDTVAFDKTGTLTSGELRVVGTFSGAGTTITGAADGAHELLTTAASVETNSEHPVGRAIVAAAQGHGLELAAAQDFRSHPGSGVAAVLAGEPVQAGSLRWLGEIGVSLPEPLVQVAAQLGQDGFTVVAVARAGQLVGLISLSDTLRPDAEAAVARLSALGVRTWLLSGDSPGAVRRIAAQLGISDSAGGLLPQDKVDRVAQLSERGSGLAMVGDGINDAPALAAASVGIAVGRGGSDLAIETADVVLLSSDLGRVPDAIELGRRTLSNIRFNIGLSGLAIVGLFAAAALGYVGPVAGALVHEGSALLVTLNAMRLLGRRPQEHSSATGEVVTHAHQTQTHTHNHTAPGAIPAAHGHAVPSAAACAHGHSHTHGHSHAVAQAGGDGAGEHGGAAGRS
jgi:Cd2+/Zn2+-exporting ATPase